MGFTCIPGCKGGGLTVLIPQPTTTRGFLVYGKTSFEKPQSRTMDYCGVVMLRVDFGADSKPIHDIMMAACGSGLCMVSVPI